MITAAQCRAGRGLLKWTQPDLATRSDVGLNTIKKFETEATAPHKSTLKALKTAFEAAGIEFLYEGGPPPLGGGQGVRFRK